MVDFSVLFGMTHFHTLPITNSSLTLFTFNINAIRFHFGLGCWLSSELAIYAQTQTWLNNSAQTTRQPEVKVTKRHRSRSRKCITVYCASIRPPTLVIGSLQLLTPSPYSSSVINHKLPLTSVSAYAIDLKALVYIIRLLYFAWANQRRRQYCITRTVQFKVQLAYTAPP